MVRSLPISRREMVIRTGLLASLLTLGISTRAFAGSPGQALEDLANAIDPLTRQLRAAGPSGAEEWRVALNAVFNAVELHDLLSSMDFEALASRMGYAHRGVTTQPVDIPGTHGRTLSFLPKMFAVGQGRAIVPHGHDNMVSAHFTLSGRFRLRQYDKLDVSPDALLIRPSIDRSVSPGDLSSIGTEADNVHWFEAETPAHTLDVIVLGLDGTAERDFDIYNLDVRNATSAGGDILRAPRISVPDALRLYG